LLYPYLAFYRLITSALINLREITELYLYLAPTVLYSSFEGFEHFSFPNLWLIHLEVELTPSVLGFLDHHRLCIRNLSIPYDVDPLPQTSLYTFPALEFYSGTFELIPAFLPGSPVRSITSDICATDEVENVLATLKMTTVPLEVIAFTSKTWNLRFFECLSRYAPNVLDLEFQSDDEDADGIEVS
jgi:hypothetical protein